jgi:heterodisulfide reductase subunit C
MAEEMDYPPDKIVRMVQLGLKETALRSRAIWLCTGCLACSDRCPNGIDVAKVMDTLKQVAMAERYPSGEPRISGFHKDFLGVVKQYGRLHEATLMALLKLKTRDLMSDMAVGIKMVLMGKIPILPQRIRGRAEVVRLIDIAAGSNSKPAAHGGAK